MLSIEDALFERSSAAISVAGTAPTDQLAGAAHGQKPPAAAAAAAAAAKRSKEKLAEAEKGREKAEREREVISGEKDPNPKP